MVVYVVIGGNLYIHLLVAVIHPCPLFYDDRYCIGRV